MSENSAETDFLQVWEPFREFSVLAQPNVMKFYYYVYLRSRKVTIHRAECPFCRQGKGLQRKIFKDANGFWSGPYLDYETVVEQASVKASEISAAPIDCKHCRPLREETLTTSASEQKRLPALNQLDEQHASEQRQFANFYENIQQLMEDRHRAEHESGEMKSSDQEVRAISVQHHAQQVAELAEAQRLSYALLQEKQAREKDDYVKKR